MSTWTEPVFIKNLLIVIVGLSISVWWLYKKIKSKLEEVQERQENIRKRV
ncbi:MAG: hypothetical protein ACPG68_05340 [Candidatus Thalassarchaeaceae archaeon]|jgi:hypothetical protein|tara:strand:- start:155 stop:304 length:150 start_codon:yes stop_codon:yes gene_type:complete